jgi:hypothetical protein
MCCTDGVVYCQRKLFPEPSPTSGPAQPPVEGTEPSRVDVKGKHALSKTRAVFVNVVYFARQSEGVFFLLFSSTLVVKIEKTQESTTSWGGKAVQCSKRITEDKEDTLLLRGACPLSI